MSKKLFGKDPKIIKIALCGSQLFFQAIIVYMLTLVQSVTELSNKKCVLPNILENFV